MTDFESALAVARILDSIGNCVPLRNAWERLAPRTQAWLKRQWQSAIAAARHGEAAA
jgi:hypothetical protein